MIHKDMTVIALNTEQHLSTCGYWYLVQSDGCTAHTAFKTRQGLVKWLDERGLSVVEIPTALQPEDYGKGLVNYCPIDGQYASQMHNSMAAFCELPNVVVCSKTLSNAEYVTALITQDGGLRTVHTLNPNVRNRRVFDYWEADKEMS